MHLRPVILTTSFLVLSAMTTASTAWAGGWGCFVRSSDGRQGFGYGHNSKAEATAAQLTLCKRAGGSDCTILACKSNVNTEAQAEAAFGVVSIGPGTVRCPNSKMGNC